jgi:hypothetical protein
MIMLILTTFIATVVALCKGLMVLIGVLLGGAAFLRVLFALLVGGVNALIHAWYVRSATAHA